MLIRVESTILQPKLQKILYWGICIIPVVWNCLNSMEISQFCGFTFCVGLNISHVKLNTVFCVSCPLFFFLSFKLQSASEYEERKLIRAAIRRLRDEEIRGEILSKGLDKYLYTSACVYIPLFSFTGALEKVQTAGQRTERRQNPQNCFDIQVSKCGVVISGAVNLREYLGLSLGLNVEWGEINLKTQDWRLFWPVEKFKDTVRLGIGAFVLFLAI